MKTQSAYLDQINEGIIALPLAKEPRGLYAPIKYALMQGGKRLRPMLTLAAADALGADPAKFLNQALAIEVFHNFTLLHDDVMDKAEVRRGQPTVHCRWNENTAILSGDAMLSFASLLLTDGLDPDKLPAALELFNRTAIEVYEGQQLDMDFEERRRVTVGDYMEMIRLKTSVLLGCAIEMGAIVAGADLQTRNALYRYGILLGLAFQLRDDLLDSLGDPALFGKAIGGDILSDKKTWLLINALLEAPQDVEPLLGPATDKTEKIERVTAIYRRLNLDSQCQTLIDEHIDQAIAALDEANLPPEARQFFTDLALSTKTRVN